MDNDQKSKLLAYLKSNYEFQEIPMEGGLAFQTYISDEAIPDQALPDRYAGSRQVNSLIYFLLEDKENCFSAMHQLKTDETYHYYIGDPVEMLLLYSNGTSETLLLGSDILNGQNVQHTVPRGTWQGSHLLPGGKFAFMAASMSPGFDSRDFTLGKRDDLVEKYPDRKLLITQLTRKLDLGL